MKGLDKNMLLTIISLAVSISSLIIFNDLTSYIAYGNEEDLSILQTGVISTSNTDYQISNEFDTRILQDGKLIRITGITISGEPYYAYQKMIGDE